MSLHLLYKLLDLSKVVLQGQVSGDREELAKMPKFGLDVGRRVNCWNQHLQDI